jgi:hypothetical protein
VGIYSETWAILGSLIELCVLEALFLYNQRFAL